MENKSLEQTHRVVLRIKKKIRTQGIIQGKSKLPENLTIHF